MSRQARHDWILSGVRGGGRWGRKRRATGGSFPFSRRLRIEPLEDRRLLALVTVTTLNDTVDFNDGVTSLREAIFATNLVGGPDTIDFAPSLTSGGPAALLLTQGELKITDALSINGPGASLLTIDASGNDPTPNVNNGDGSRVFNIDDLNLATQFDVSISGLTLTGGDLGGGSAGSGGAIFTRENLSISGSTIRGNSTLFRGGGIAVMVGNLTVADSTISGNMALGGYGGGIYSRGTSALLRNTLTVTASSISGNSASANGGGGGISGFNTNLSVVGSTISGNAASSNGGGIFVYRGNVTATDSTISGNSARDGGGIHGLRGDIVVSGSTLSGNAATGNGGGISSIAGNTTVTTSTISGNSASSGGGVKTNASLMITDSTISDNLATGNGGGIVLNIGGVLNVMGGAISANSAGGNGGGIASSGMVTVAGAIISGNSATTRGGGIWNSGGTATLTSTTVDDNSARYGGGIYSGGGGGSITIASSQVLNNSASRSGGGIYSRRNLMVSNTTISGNSAALAGGGIVSFGGNLTVAGSTISNNAAHFGGGIAGGATGNVMSISSSTISGNSASDRAGGIFNGSGGTLTLSHSTVSGNTAKNKSGGIGAYAAATLNHTIVAGNTRGESDPSDVKGSVALGFSLLGVDTGATIIDNGGNLIGTAAVPIDPLLGPLADDGGPTFTHALLAGSPAINAGDLSAVAGVGGVPEFDQRGTPFGRVFNGRIDIGAFEYQAASDLNLVVDTLADESDGNYALGDLSLREAILLANTWPSTDTIHFDPALTAGGPATILLTMGELKITDDTTINGPGASLLTIDASGNDPTPDANEGNGSRVFNIDDGNNLVNIDVLMSGLTLTGGDAMGAGGGVFTCENLTLADCVITGNATFSSGTLGGGGIYSSALYTPPNSLKLIKCSITNNVAVRNEGGGIRKRAGSLVIDGCMVSGNTALFGGGLSAADAGIDIQIDASTFSGNSATGRSYGGGAIFTFGGNLTLTESTISGNSARQGGGLYLTGEATLRGCTIIDNSATNTGGGVFIILSGTRTPKVIGCTISGNTATGRGGGIFGSGFGGVIVTDCKISGNVTTNGSRGGGISGDTLTISGSTISENIATNGSGGGIAGGAVTVTSSTISGNSANGNGGGILATVATILGSTINGNLAGVGGGIWASNLTAIGSTISGNSAGSGGGIAGNTVTVTSSTILTNSAIDAGGGISADIATVTSSRISYNSEASGGGIAGRALTVAISTISNNSADFGGGIDGDILTLIDSTVSDNLADDDGGGIFNRGGVDNVIAITNSTINRNYAAGDGGALYLFAPVVSTIRHTTMAQNSAGTFGGGIFVASGQLNLDHSIVASNTADLGLDMAVLFGVIIEARYSLIGINSSTPLAEAPLGMPDANGNLIGGPIAGLINPGLTSLDDFGGPTMTHALLPGSPAINAGDPAAVAGVGDVPLFDQRGTPFTRVVGGRIDIGAFEVQPSPLALVGDFNQNGEVDAADYVVWRHAMANGVAARSSADGSGTMDAADYDVWRANFGQSVAAANGAGAHVAESLRDSVVAVSERLPYVSRDSAWVARPELPAMGVAVDGTVRQNHALRLGRSDVPLGRPRLSTETAPRALHHEAALIAWLTSHAECDNPHPDADVSRPANSPSVDATSASNLTALDQAFAALRGDFL
jgi:hypothetical protein